MENEIINELLQEPNRWYVRENEYCWQLFYGPRTGLVLDLQIIKAPKHDSSMAEYWPTEEQTKFIVDALNSAEKLKSIK